jgi:class 3 adenylate cyclase
MHVPIPIRGVLSLPFKLAGVRISRMNPNLCTLCETKFRSVKKTQQVTVPATVLFADVRGYTSLSEEVGAGDVTTLLGEFYDHCSTAVWERDGIVNKLIGDAILPDPSLRSRQAGRLQWNRAAAALPCDEDHEAGRS